MFYRGDIHMLRSVLVHVGNDSSCVRLLHSWVEAGIIILFNTFCAFSFVTLLPQGESGGAFKSFKGFSLTPLAPAAGGSFSAFGNGAGFKPISSLTNGSAASVTPAFGAFNSPATVAKANTGEACCVCVFCLNRGKACTFRF